MSSTTSQPLKIAVVGGGIAGLCTVLGLLQAKKRGAHIQVDVYESAHKFGEIGAGVAFGPNAQRALDLLGCKYAMNATADVRPEHEDIWFDYKAGEKGHPLESQTVGQVTGKGAGTGSVHRADFLDQLIKHVPESIAHFHHRCRSYDILPSGGVAIHFENGTTTEADVLIASDGIKSSVRRHLYERKGLPIKDQEAEFSGWVAWRGLIPREKYDDLLGADSETADFWLGKDRHILTFSVRSGTVVNLVGFVLDKDKKKLGSHTGPWSEPRPSEELLEDYAGFHEPMIELLKSIEDPSIWGIFHLPEIKEWVDETVVLTGDAAHATTPHQGSGAGQAVEDALFISELLTAPKTLEASDRSKAIRRTLEVFHSKRHERGWQVQKTSYEAGLLWNGRGIGGEGEDMEKIMKNASHRMKWIWDYDIEADLKDAVASL